MFIPSIQIDPRCFGARSSRHEPNRKQRHFQRRKGRGRSLGRRQDLDENVREQNSYFNKKTDDLRSLDKENKSGQVILS